MGPAMLTFVPPKKATMIPAAPHHVVMAFTGGLYPCDSRTPNALGISPQTTRTASGMETDRIDAALNRGGRTRGAMNLSRAWI